MTVDNPLEGRRLPAQRFEIPGRAYIRISAFRDNVKAKEKAIKSKVYDEKDFNDSAVVIVILGGVVNKLLL